MLWYACHSFLPASKEPGHGIRNVRTFLVGAFLYIVLYVILKNLQLKYGSWYGAPSTQRCPGCSSLADGAGLALQVAPHHNGKLFCAARTEQGIDSRDHGRDLRDSKPCRQRD